MKIIVLAAGIIAYLVLPQAARAQGDAAKGITKAQGCVVCHNADRLNLAGKDSAGLVAAMKEIKKGKLSHPPVLGDLNNADMEDIAAYLSSLKR